MPSFEPALLSPRLRHLHGATTVIDARWRYLLRSPHWRLYRNRDAGAWIDHPGGRLQLVPNQFVWLPAWGDFRSGCSGRVRHLFMHVAIDALDGDWHAGALDRPQPLPRDELLERLAERSEESGDVRWAESLEYAAFAVWCGHLPERVATALRNHIEAPDPIAPALRLVEERFASAIGVRQLAEACGCSDDTLNRLMRRRTGRSPAAWIRRRRCALAAERLADSDLPIEQVATMHGFANRHHFTRVFTTIMGCGPAEHRRVSRAWRD